MVAVGLLMVVFFTLLMALSIQAGQLRSKEETLEKLLLLVLQRRLQEGLLGLPSVGRHAASHESASIVRCAAGRPQAIATTHPARTAPGATSPAPPGTPGDA